MPMFDGEAQIIYSSLKQAKVRKEHNCFKCKGIIAKGEIAYWGYDVPIGDWSQMGFPEREYVCSKCMIEQNKN